MMELINRVIDKDSFCEIKKLFATELITGLARIDGRVVGIIANQPRAKGGVLFTDSADKAAKFIQLCDALDRKSTRLNSSHVAISYAVFCLKKKRKLIKKPHT